jgi:hypothetical protein
LVDGRVVTIMTREEREALIADNEREQELLQADMAWRAARREAGEEPAEWECPEQPEPVTKDMHDGAVLYRRQENAFLGPVPVEERGGDDLAEAIGGALGEIRSEMLDEIEALRAELAQIRGTRKIDPRTMARRR